MEMDQTQAAAAPVAADPEKPPQLTQSPPRPEDMELSERANLAALYNEEEAKKFVTKLLDKYQRDVASRAMRMKKVKDLQEQYALVAKPKNFPFQKAANVKTPTITGPNLQIQSRLYDMIWPRAGKVFSVISGDIQNSEVAKTAETFANSYVRYKLPYMAQSLDATLHQMCLYGSTFRRTYWDAYEKKVRSDFVGIEDFVVAYDQQSHDPSLSDVEFYTMVHHMTIDTIEEYGIEGSFINADRVRAKRGEAEHSEHYDQNRKIDGTDVDTEDEFAPRQVLEIHCRWKLPKSGKHPAFDGRAHWLVVVVDAGSETLLKVSLREEDDPDDKRRYDRQMQEYQQRLMAQEQYAVALESYKQRLLQAQAMTLAAPPDVAAMVPHPDPGPAPQQPEPPGQPPKPARKRQICFFTHYRCFPLDGCFYGLGYGDILYGLALAMNTLINQHIDGITLKNSKPMFMSRQLRMQKGAINVQPGEVVEVDGPVDAIRNGIMFLDPPQNDPSTMSLVKMLDGMKDGMVGSSDLMSGQAPGSNQTKVGMQILAEQAMTPITVLGRRVESYFQSELYKIWRCWGVFLEDEEVADIVNDNGAPESIKVGKAMFAPTAQLVPSSDPRIKSQRVEEFNQLFGFVQNNPFVQQSPAAQPTLRALTEQGYRLFGGESLIQYLPPPQVGPPPPPPPKDPNEENAGFLRNEAPEVHPEDNDEAHTATHMMFGQSPEAQLMDAKQRQAYEQHMRNHAAAKITKGAKALEQQRNAILGPQGGGPGPMEGQPGNPAAGGMA